MNPVNISYRKYKPEDFTLIHEFMLGLYTEDPTGKPLDEEKIKRTIQNFKTHPETGAIFMIEADGEPAGYSILVNYWSNEFGGYVVFIDELYIMAQIRNKGIASVFIRMLKDSGYKNMVALQIEVMPINKGALRLYKRLGFQNTDRGRLIMEF